MSVEFSIHESVRRLFHAHGLDDFARLLAGDIGELMRRERGGRELRRLSLPDTSDTQQFYLKRLGREPAPRLLKAVLSGHRPLSGPIRELTALRQLRKAGFAVMEPVAWGEQRQFGLPVAGFLAVRGVAGADAAQLFETLRGAERLALLAEVGGLVGRLHAAGFFQVVRLKDLIRDRHSGEFVLIDRETGKPWPTRFSRHRAIASLARAGRRTLRDGHRFGPASLRGFLTGYAQGVTGSWMVSPGELRKLVASRLRQELDREG